jgi:DNA-binding NarL/FixJ family response regulator
MSAWPSAVARRHNPPGPRPGGQACRDQRSTHPLIHSTASDTRAAQQAIRVILADDHELVRAGISALLSLEPDIHVAAEARDGASLLALLEHTRVDVVVCDLAMPGMGGLEAVERVHQRWPELRVVVLSMDDSAASARLALRNGASGYVAKHAARDELRTAILATMQGRQYLSPAIARALAAGQDAPQDQLTTRQLEILVLVAQGHSSREIGERLGLSHKTVDVHRLRIMDRLGIRDVAGLTRYAMRQGLVS